MFKKLAIWNLGVILILSISLVVLAQQEKGIPNYNAVVESMRTMEGALEKSLDNASISYTYIPDMGAFFICDTVFKTDLGDMDKKVAKLIKALGPLVEVKEDENICVVIKYGGFTKGEQEYIVIAPKTGITNQDKWEVFSSETKVTGQPEEKETSYFSTPENTVKTLMEAIVFENKELAYQCFSDRVPRSLLVEPFVDSAIEGFSTEFERGKKENPKLTKFEILNARSYEKEEIDNNTFYVWGVNLNTGKRIEKVCFRVARENSKWKILAPKSKEKTFLSLIKPVAKETQPFFDLSTPENTARSFIETTILKDNEKAKKCWSDRVPEFVKILAISVIQEGFEESAEKSPELKLIFQDPKAMKSALEIFDYEKEQIDEESFYVWYVARVPDEANATNSKDWAFKVVKEGNEWKILASKGMEDNPFFKSIIEKPKQGEQNEQSKNRD